MEPKDCEERTEMNTRLTPPLTFECMAEIAAELDGPPADTPQRRATFARAREADFLVQQMLKHPIPKQK
jgi:hypothetical protein